MITIRYSCPKCGFIDRPVQVPARATADQDVRVWMHTVAACLSGDHETTSPGCAVHALSNIKIPNPPEAEFVGQQIE